MKTTWIFIPVLCYLQARKGDSNLSGSRRRSIKITGSWKKMFGKRRVNKFMKQIDAQIGPKRAFW